MSESDRPDDSVQRAEREERRRLERERRASELEVAEAKLKSWSLAKRGDSVIEFVELLIYAGVSVVLVLGALALLGDSAKTFVETLDQGVLRAATQMLSVLLLVFVFVELLGAVRTTIRERRLVAEPFLLVGIIAAIKEIVLVAGTQRSDEVTPQLFRDAMIEVGVLALVVLVLAIATLLLRSKAPVDKGRPPVLDDRSSGRVLAGDADEA